MRLAVYETIEDQVLRVIVDAIFRPALAAIKEFDVKSLKSVRRDVLSNDAIEPLDRALRLGVIQYVNGTFSGQFSAAISKSLRQIGASFDKRSGIYKIDATKVPGWVLSAAADFMERARVAHERIRVMIDLAVQRIDEVVDGAVIDAESVVHQVTSEWKSTARKLEVKSEITADAKKRLEAGYRESMKLPIKDFTKAEAVKLRKAVQDNAESGYRFDTLADAIRHRYGVAESKAKFLARQETSIFMSKFREERFKDVGVRRYVWHTSNDERVRHGHKDLNGTVQFFDNPPIVDPTTGRRANPGEDFMCRCVAVPMLDEVAVTV